MSAKLEKNYYIAKRVWYKNKYWSSPPGNIFSINGISGPEALESKYSCILSLFQKDGAVIDFGCGNGLLLKYLMKNTGVELEPFGVDFIEESIESAKTEILPEHGYNFICKNILDYVFDRKFDYVIICPMYLLDDDFVEFYARCLESLNKGGVFIAAVTGDLLWDFRNFYKKTLGLSEKRKMKKIENGDVLYLYEIL